MILYKYLVKKRSAWHYTHIYPIRKVHDVKPVFIQDEKCMPLYLYLSNKRGVRYCTKKDLVHDIIPVFIQEEECMIPEFLHHVWANLNCLVVSVAGWLGACQCRSCLKLVIFITFHCIMGGKAVFQILWSEAGTAGQYQIWSTSPRGKCQRMQSNWCDVKCCAITVSQLYPLGIKYLIKSDNCMSTECIGHSLVTYCTNHCRIKSVIALFDKELTLS